MNCLQGRNIGWDVWGNEVEGSASSREFLGKMQGKEMVIVAFVSVPKDLTKVKKIRLF